MEVSVYMLVLIQIFRARDIAVENKESQDALWEKITRDDYMKYAVEECYHCIKVILTAILENEGRMWYVFSFIDEDLYGYNLPIML